MVVVIVVPAGAKVSRLPSLKEPLENKFSRGSNSHRLLITITPTIESLCFFICPRSFCAIYTKAFLKMRTFLIEAELSVKIRVKSEIGGLTSNHRDVFMVEIIAVPD